MSVKNKCQLLRTIIIHFPIARYMFMPKNMLFGGENALSFTEFDFYRI
jgi:hypothetical protein